MCFSIYLWTLALYLRNRFLGMFLRILVFTCSVCWMVLLINYVNLRVEVTSPVGFKMMCGLFWSGQEKDPTNTERPATNFKKLQKYIYHSEQQDTRATYQLKNDKTKYNVNRPWAQSFHSKSGHRKLHFNNNKPRRTTKTTLEPKGWTPNPNPLQPNTGALKINHKIIQNPFLLMHKKRQWLNIDEC